MPGTYENFGVKFLFPDNWEMGDEEVGQPPYEVSFQIPGGGFWMLRVYEGRIGCDELLREARETMESEYEGIESSPFINQVDDTEIYGCEMNFYYLDLVVTAKSQCFTTADRTFLIHVQAESRDFEANEPVFRAMMTSLLRGDG